MRICVTLGKCVLSSPLPTHGYDLSEHSLFPGKNMGNSTACVFSVLCCLCVLFCRCVCVQCVEPEGERASVQLTGSDYDLTRPLFVHMKQSEPHPPCAGCSEAACPCVFVCQRECTFHTCDHCGGSRGSKLLCEA